MDNEEMNAENVSEETVAEQPIENATEEVKAEEPAAEPAEEPAAAPEEPAAAPEPAPAPVAEPAPAPVAEPAHAPQPTPAAVTPAKPKKGNAVASLVLGILSLVLCSIGGILGLIGLINGIVGVKKKQKKGLAVTGIVLNSLGIVVGLIVLVASIVAFAMFGTTIFGLIKLAQSPAVQSAGQTISSMDWDSIDPDNLEDSIKQQVISSVTESAMDALDEKLSSEEGLSFSDSNGNSYTIQGDSIKEAVITDEETGMEINVGDYLDMFQTGKDEMMGYLEDEYGLTEDDVNSILASLATEAGVEVDADTVDMLFDMLE